MVVDGRVGLLRRVQPHQHRGVIGGGAADPLHPLRARRRIAEVLILSVLFLAYHVTDVQ